MIRIGVVLAGGQSRRMGQDKALMSFQGERLIDRAIRKLDQQVDILVVNRSTPIPGLSPKIHHVPDQFTGFQGPLAGIHATLAWLNNSSFTKIYKREEDPQNQDNQLFTVPVDSPFFPANFVERLTQASSPVAFACSQGQRHPVFGRWPLCAVSVIESALEKGQRRIDRVAETLGFEEVEWPLMNNKNAQQLDPFENINTMKEFLVVRD